MKNENSQKPSISAFVICCNEEQKIARCLASLQWCDEVVLVDSGSTDRTLEIAGQYSAKVIHHSWTGFLAQKQFGLAQCQGEWVLNIDADEEVSPELAREILAAINAPQGNANGFELLRVVFFLGKWWRKGGWYPEYRLRVLRRIAASWGGEDPHERAIVAGPVRRLRGELRHYTYDSVADQVRSLNSHSTVAAASLYRKGRQTALVEILTRPVVRFVKFYVLKKGFLEGAPGLFAAVAEAYYVFLKYTKLWEMTRCRDRMNGPGGSAPGALK